MCIRHGSPPFLECSSRGDKRFSAFFARIKSLNNCTIETLYQGFKIFPDGSNCTIKEAKGRKAINQKEAHEYYSYLWDLYFQENPDLLEVIKQFSGVSDMFGKVGSCCQATEIWFIRNTALMNDQAL